MPAAPSAPDEGREQAFDVVVVGAGFAGLYMLHRLRGLGLSAHVYEQGSGVGGTWYWNRYPGARCDVESMQYSYSFSHELQQEWDWSERYASQPEILQYANHVADRFDLRQDISFNTCVERAEFDEKTATWKVRHCRRCAWRAQDLWCWRRAACPTPAFPTSRACPISRGRSTTPAHWPHEQVDFTGQRVGVIGTGSSGIQSVPVIAEQAQHLYVFQRTPNFSIPAHNAPLTDEARAAFRTNYPEIRRFAREETRNGIYTELPDRGAFDDGENARRARYEQRWANGGLTFMVAYNNLVLDQDAQRHRRRLRPRENLARSSRIRKPAESLQPDSHPIGTKRICVDTNYYATFNRPNVTLVDISAGAVEEILPNAIRAGGEEYEIDALVLATGFDAMTGSVARIDIRGRNDVTLNRKWAEGPKTYLGLMSEGLPQSLSSSPVPAARRCFPT